VARPRTSLNVKNLYVHRPLGDWHSPSNGPASQNRRGQNLAEGGWSRARIAIVGIVDYASAALLCGIAGCRCAGGGLNDMDSPQFVVGVEWDDRHRCRGRSVASNARSGNRPASSSASMTCASSASQAQSCSSGSGDTCGVIRQRMARSAGVRRVLLHHLTQRLDTGRGRTSHANCSPSASIGYDRDRSVFFEPPRTADTNPPRATESTET
jgi:hypothetical protein